MGGVLSVTRTQLREGRFTLDQRVALAEDDLDTHDGVQLTQAQAIKNLEATIQSSLNKILFAVLTLAFTIAGAAIAFAYSSGKA